MECVALGLIANIFAVITFGITILDKSHDIYTSASGTLECNGDLEVVIASLTEKVQALRDSLTAFQHHPGLSGNDQTVILLCERSLKLSDELGLKLKSVRVQEPKTKWKSTRKALRSLYEKQDINSLKQRLADLNQELDSRVINELPSKIDFVAFKASQHFETQSIETRNLVNLILDSQRNFVIELDEQNDRIDAKFVSTTNAIQNAIQDAISKMSTIGSQASERLAETVRLEMAHTKRALLQQGEKIDRLQQTIDQLQEDKDKLWQCIESAIPKIVLDKRKPEEQAEVQEQVKIWFKLWQAKDELLQKLKKFLALINQILTRDDWLLWIPTFDLELVERLTRFKNTTNYSSADEHQRAVTAAQCDMLLSFIDAANPAFCNNFIAQNIINHRTSRTIDLNLLGLDPSARWFYQAIYPRARLSEEWKGRPTQYALFASMAYSMPVIQMDVTPLIFTVLELRLLQRSLETSSTDTRIDAHLSAARQLRLENMQQILNILLDGGADMRTCDNAGVSAYQHARILGLDDDIIAKLRPPDSSNCCPVTMPQPTYSRRLLPPKTPTTPTSYSHRSACIELQSLGLTSLYPL